jgi:hypothetical protein
VTLTTRNESAIANTPGASDGILVDTAGDPITSVTIPAGTHSVTIPLAYTGVSDPQLADTDPGDVVLTASTPTITGTIRFLSRDVLVTIVTDPAGGVVTVGSTITVTVSVTTTNPPRGLPDRPITLTTSAGGFPNDVTITGSTDQNGRITVTFSAPTQSGTGSITAECGSACSATLDLTFPAGPIDRLRVSDGDGQAAAPFGSVATPPRFQAVDAFGNPIAGVDVAFSTAPDDGVVVPTTVRSDELGFAAVTRWTLSATFGVNTLTATVIGSDPPITTTITALTQPPAPDDLVGISGSDEAWILFTLAPGIDAYEIQLTNPPRPFGDAWIGLPSSAITPPLHLNPLAPDDVTIANDQSVCVRIRALTPQGVSLPSESVCITPRAASQYGVPGIELVLVEPDEAGGVRLGADDVLTFDFTLKNDGTADLPHIWLKPFIPAGSTLIALEPLTGGAITDYTTAWYWRDANLAAGGGTATLRFTVQLETDR